VPLSDDLDSLKSPGVSGSDRRDSALGEAWRPRLELDASGGFLVSTPRNASEQPDASAILKEFDLDPTAWLVTALRRSRWQRYDGEWLEAYRLSLAPATGIPAKDVDSLVAEIIKWRPKKVDQMGGDSSFLVCPSDQQIGKTQGSDGTSGSVYRILEATERAVERLKELRKMGRPIASVTLALLGDHVEGNVSQKGAVMGNAVSDMGLTQQTRVARRLLMAQIKAFAPLAPVTVAVVNGNHDEATRQVLTDPQDGWNVEIASAVQDACAENEFLAERVAFRFPASFHQTLAIDVHGTIVGMFHGHQAGRDVVKYLSQQALGNTALGGADVFISGHYHGFKCLDLTDAEERAGKLWVQAPTTDPGSAWFRDKAGVSSPAGLLTMVVGAECDPRRDISVITVSR
jgi:predicted phosphodiesterase